MEQGEGDKIRQARRRRPGLVAPAMLAMLGAIMGARPPIPGSARAREADPKAPKSSADLERIRLAEERRARRAAKRGR